jgi:hypothetical protein
MFLLFRLVDMTYLIRENPNDRDIPETLVCLELQNSVIRGRELSGARLAARHSSKVSVAALSIVAHEKETVSRHLMPCQVELAAALRAQARRTTVLGPAFLPDEGDAAHRLPCVAREAAIAYTAAPAGGM